MQCALGSCLLSDARRTATQRPGARYHSRDTLQRSRPYLRLRTARGRVSRQERGEEMKRVIPRAVRLLLAYIAEQRKAEAALTAKLNGYGQNRAMDKAGRRR